MIPPNPTSFPDWLVEMLEEPDAAFVKVHAVEPIGDNWWLVFFETCLGDWHRYVVVEFHKDKIRTRNRSRYATKRRAQHEFLQRCVVKGGAK